MSRSSNNRRSGGAPPGPANRQGKYNVRKLSRAEEAQSTAEPEPVGPATAAPSTSAARPRRRFGGRRVLIGIAIGLLLAIGLAALWAWWTVQKTLPTINGTIKFAGLSAPVTITRDTYGIPHILAATPEDMYAAEGYVHAQDRLFEMFSVRSVGQGRRSELAGSDAIGADRFVRIIGFQRSAEAEAAKLSPDAQKWLQAYARGVNEFIHTHGDALPLEFLFLGSKVEDWSPVDSIAFGKLEAWELSDTWDDDLMTADLRAKFPTGDRASVLLPGYPASAPVTVPGGNSGAAQMVQAYNEKVKPWLPDLGLNDLGSNNWVVDGSKSTTGKPLLANDPHLAVRNPSIWYQVQLSTTDGKYDITGFSFPGAPGVITGHNRNIAWGVTNTETDVQDLYQVKLDEQGHPGQYQTASGWKPLQVITETINVKGGSPVSMTIRLTDEGPIISDAFQEPYTTTLGSTIKEPYALQWTASQPGHLMESVFALQTASNWNEFRTALSKWDVPGQNFVYADTQGNIGYQMTGQVPVRKKGDGSVPVPGWTGEYGWTGFIPFDELPRAYNPPDHYVATANNKPYGSSYQPQFSGDWAYPWRIQRITDMLKAKDKLGIDDFRAMQADTVSLSAQKFAPIIANLKPTGQKEQQAVQLFKDWNGDLKPESTQAAIYEVMVQRALTDTFADDLGQDLFVEYVVIGGNKSLRALEDLLDKPNDAFWDRTDTPNKETRDDILNRALSEAMGDLTNLAGDNMSDWTWGKIHTMTPVHAFGSQPVISGIFNMSSVPVGGDSTTVSVGTYQLGGSFAVVNHQSYRMIEDVGNWANSIAIFSTGQSGQPFSKHWGDMLTPWQTYQYNPMLTTPQQVDAQKEGVLTLTP